MIVPRKHSDTLFSFDLFNWLPQNQKNLCSLILCRIEYLGSWNRISVQNRKAELFPYKQITDVEYCPFIVKLHETFPFIYDKEDEITN